jgi:hypothetical protein
MPKIVITPHAIRPRVTCGSIVLRSQVIPNDVWCECPLDHLCRRSHLGERRLVNAESYRPNTCCCCGAALNHELQALTASVGRRRFQRGERKLDLTAWRKKCRNRLHEFKREGKLGVHCPAPKRGSTGPRRGGRRARRTVPEATSPSPGRLAPANCLEEFRPSFRLTEPGTPPLFQDECNPGAADRRGVTIRMSSRGLKSGPLTPSVAFFH